VTAQAPASSTATADRGVGTTRLLLSMGLASGITSVPNAAIVLALPTLHRQFDASMTMLEWTVVGYMLAYGSLLIAAGRLADMFGRRRILIVGTLVYVGASIVGALANDALILIAALIACGAGGAILTPASLAIVTDAFRGPRRSMAVGVWGAATAIFSGIGPAIGGVFTGELSWRWILWLNVIAGAFILAGAWKAPESRDEQAEGGRRSLDVVGLACSVGFLAALALALNEAPAEWPWTSPQTITAFTVAAVLLVAFVITEPRVRQPLIDLRLFARRNLSGAAISLLVLNFGLGAVLFFIPTYMQELLGYDPLKAGLLLLPMSIGMGVAMPIGARLFERLGPRWPVIAGMLITAVGVGLLAGIDRHTRYADLWLPLTLLGLGVGTTLTPLNLAALGAVPQRLHAVIGGIVSTVAEIGAMFGVAVSGALFEALQNDHTVTDAAKAGIAISNETASTLGGLLAQTPSATKLLDTFPQGQHATLTAAVHDGFLSALSTTMLLSVGVVLVGLALSAWLIRRRPPATV
jgi:EmrB/QacA subfamily drug resistance transporter